MKIPSRSQRAKKYNNIIENTTEGFNNRLN